MNTPTHNILITINATAEQLAATDALYEIIGPELKANEELKYKFNTFFHSNLNGQQLIDAFAKVMQPAIARLANNLGETLSLPLYMSLAKHITTEWVQKPSEILPGLEATSALGTFEGEPLAISTATYDGLQPSGVIEVSKADAEMLEKLAEEQPKPNEALTKAFEAHQTAQATGELFVKDPKASIAQLDTAQVRELITDIDPEAPRPALPVFTGEVARTDSPLARGSAGQDRSKPVLNARVLRGFDSLVAALQVTETGRSEAVPALTKGNRDAQTALKYLDRMVAWAKLNDRM